MVEPSSGALDTLKWLFVEHFRDYDHWPWSCLNAPSRQFEEHASFVVCELLFFSLAVLSFCHAFGCRGPGQRLRLIWIATFIVGTVNDYIFMLLPVVDNFWQAQGLIMLTPRMPLYIPCVYNAFMYWPAVAAARVFRSGRCAWAEASFGGLLSGLFYAPYDVCGQHFLWWTWHDSDPGVRLRWLGVPAGSTAWTITFGFSFCLLLRVSSDRNYEQLRSLAFLCMSTPLMLVVINIFTILGVDSFGMPGPRTVLAACAIFGTVASIRLVTTGGDHAPRRPAIAEPLLVRIGLAAYFLTLVLSMACFSPQDQISTGVHQEFGPCNVTDVDLLGYPRARYICREHYPKSSFSLDCPQVSTMVEGRWKRLSPEESTGMMEPLNVASWYTICGLKDQPWQSRLTAVACFAALGIAAFSWSLSSGDKVALDAACELPREDAQNSVAGANHPGSSNGNLKRRGK